MTKNEIKNLNKIQKDTEKRITKAIEIFGDRNLSKEAQKEFKKITNSNHQDEMTTIFEIEKKYSNISPDFIAKQLVNLGYMQYIENVLYPKKPYSDYYLVPYFQNGQLKGSHVFLVVSQEVEKKLQEFCDKELYRNWELHS